MCYKFFKFVFFRTNMLLTFIVHDYNGYKNSECNVNYHK